MATLAEALDAAVKHHQRGELPLAERLYREILKAHPRHADAWHLLGLVALASQKPAAARDCIQQALACDPRQPTYHNHLAEAYRALGQTVDAEQSCRQALQLKPDLAVAHNTLGMVLAQQGDAPAAIAAFGQALACKPDFAEAHHNLASLLQQRGQLSEAIEHYARAVAIEGDRADVHGDLAAALAELGRTNEAAESYRRALQLDPRRASAHFGLAVLCQGQGRLEEAAACYDRLLGIDPTHADALNNLGQIHKARGHLDEAIGCYERALAARPDYAEALNNLGNVFKLQGRVADATICYEQSLRIKPHDAQARYNRALMYLAAGDFEVGWSEYEWRLECRNFPQRTFAQPRWHGEPLEGQTLLVHAEQGLGDVVQWIRYVPRLNLPRERLWVEVPSALLPLLNQAGFGELARLMGAGSPLDNFDRHVPLASLPGLLAGKYGSLAADVPYLNAAPHLVDHWRKILGAAPGLRVGIAWQGNPDYPGDRYRSIPLAQFATLAQENVELVSLQRGFGSEQLSALSDRLAVRNLGAFDEAGAFLDTAAIIRHLDLVITSDSAIAHVAGALGAEVWLALAIEPDWRWLRDREDSIWYPKMRLFRQTRFDDWTDVFERMAAELARRKT